MLVKRFVQLLIKNQAQISMSNILKFDRVQESGKGTGRTGNQRKNQDYSDHNIAKIWRDLSLKI